ncbi:MAG TPA: sulfotransferase [Longimicrobiaceae bacterium]|nr:sulfotransferase [Longimicrobiaceae bacterium]
MQRDGPRPNLFIIGSMKSGTSSLHQHLGSHPEVFMCEPKEPGFFVPEMTYYPKDEAWYRGLFAEAGDARIVGESSTHYTKLPVYAGVPERIQGYSPDARFIYLVRDPVKRAVSHYWHEVRKRRERRPMLAALRGSEQYVAFGDYQRQLAPYFERFGRERVLVLPFEMLVRRPRATLEEVFGWLGVNASQGTHVFPRENARPEEMEKVRGLGMLHAFAHSSAWGRVAPLAPSWIRRLGSRLATAPVRPEDTSDEEAIRYLRPIYREKVERLEEWLGRDFPDWSTVFPERAAAPTAAATA